MRDDPRDERIRERDQRQEGRQEHPRGELRDPNELRAHGAGTHLRDVLDEPRHQCERKRREAQVQQDIDQ